MMEESWAVQRESFNSAADLYDKHRPTYPEELVTDALKPFADASSVRILEIGAGTGQATRLFAARDCEILAVEPAADMVAIAARHLANNPNVSFENSKFEDWKTQSEAFDLAVSAISIFWVPEEVRYKLVAEALRPNGYFAYLQTGLSMAQEDLQREIKQVYATVLPEDHQLYPQDRTSGESHYFAREIAESGYFSKPEIKEYSLPDRILLRDDYIGLLETKSHHIVLEPELKTPIYQQIGDLIDQAGGELVMKHWASMYLARKLG